MLTYQVVAGFSEIKSELRKRANLTKSLDELQLWFSFDEGVFYAHDQDQHEKSIALAIYNSPENTWRIIFRGGGYGKSLIKHTIERFERAKLAKEMYDLYLSHGYFPIS